MTFIHLIGFVMFIVIAVGIWRYTKRHPLVAVAVAAGILLLLRWAAAQPVLTFLALAAGVGYWRSSRIRDLMRTALELAQLGWWFLSGLAEELRGPRSHTRRLGLRTIRRILANIRAGVREGEKQVPTTALVMLHPDDYEQLGPLVGVLRTELQEELRKRSRGYRVLGAPSLRLIPDETIRWRGWPHVKVSFSAQTSYDEAGAPPLEKTKVQTGPLLRRLDASGEYLADGRLALGREAMFADVIIDDRHVSRHHADVEHDGGEVWVIDNGSTNGTFVNGVQVLGRQRLRNGDQLRLGRDVSFELCAPEETTAAKTSS